MAYVTKEGLEKLKNEKEELEKVRRPEVIERIKRAKELGDLSENAEYHDAREEQSFIEGRILELKEMVNNAVIISDNNGSSKTAQVGSTVKVKIAGIEKDFTIVGPAEADPLAGLISNESPLGRAFIGHKKGEEVEVVTPKGKVRYKILKIK
ncbi:transcription elongation factor GreA [Candidatus Falkowbacteria bacterium RBG_13_39_14]|uniref:Transcription elongation factor GreA n=1 Tax=Candidatus Falkowbacteria bacterium RBG_13_39_14 TaxID=1797985 RepID=A0A1F5S180_9BACT|nr:MAG: transcription elongation factor GreA [Candidatus Falkowbacteria bacterium RBG_13_39_14]